MGKFDAVIRGQMATSDRLKLVEIGPIPPGINAKAYILNRLALQAKGNFLFLMSPEDWIRPDLLYRCEQVLRLVRSLDRTVVYCDEYTIDGRGNTLYFKEHFKKGRLPFPYYFSDDLGRGLLVPRTLWEKAGGLRETCPAGWEMYEWALRLDLLEAQFMHLPLFLYARREGQQTLGPLPLIELREYLQEKGLDWEVVEGADPQVLRAVPRVSKPLNVHVVIPYKDQKKLTMATVASLKRQAGVHLCITAVDNNSADLSIAHELMSQGIEVIRVEEPFNYSRLNNIAVDKTTTGQNCEYILLLNNDVELEPGALLEMCRWMEQPRIGMVGCRLNYPNQTLQHGGVALKRRGPHQLMVWEHEEKSLAWNALRLAKQLRVVDAVTAACAMIKRKTFLEIGGFDEVWYPIAFSDTNLCQRLARKGLWCFYTPYACGIHHESLSRHRENIEDFESSRWLSDLLQANKGQSGP
jgi:GT2 family glycosyltransferase